MADHFIYLYDPLCGWCYGASAGARLLASRPDVTIDVIPAGLFARPDAGPLSEQMAQHIWVSDKRIAELTGAVFSERYHDLLNHRSPLDSTLATLALTAVSLTEPRRELEMLGAIQKARYVDGRDITDLAILGDLLKAADLAPAAQELAHPTSALLADNSARIRRAGDLMARAGARGVPTLLREDGQGWALIDSRALYSNPLSLLSAPIA